MEAITYPTILPDSDSSHLPCLAVVWHPLPLQALQWQAVCQQGKVLTSPVPIPRPSGRPAYPPKQGLRMR